LSARGDEGELGDELLKREVLCTLLEARVMIEAWHRHYNTDRLPSSGPA